MTPITVRLVTDPIVVSEVDVTLRRTQLRRARRALVLLGSIGGVCYGAAAIGELADAGRFLHAAGYGELVLGVLFFAMVGVALGRDRRRRRVEAADDTDVTISDAGLSFVPSARHVPWRAMTEVRNVGDHFVFVGPYDARGAVVRKADLAGDGATLWKALDDRFVSKRYLVRGALSSDRIGIGQAASR